MASNSLSLPAVGSLLKSQRHYTRLALSLINFCSSQYIVRLHGLSVASFHTRPFLALKAFVMSEGRTAKAIATTGITVLQEPENEDECIVEWVVNHGNSIWT
jgi:hypothetical protein